MLTKYASFTDVDRIRRTGISVSGVFVVTFSIADMGTLYNKNQWQYSLFWKSTGQKVLEDVVFDKQGGCESFGKYLVKWYGQYLMVHPTFPENNFFQLVKWTVPNGLFLAALFEVADDFAQKQGDVVSSVSDMYIRYAQAAHSKVKWYTGGLKNWYVDNYGTKTEVA